MYIYQADHWCDACGLAICDQLHNEDRDPDNVFDESTYDSDQYPKGPYSDDFETDSLAHCASGSDCPEHFTLPSGLRLGLPMGQLTPDGIKYVLSAHATKPTEITSFWLTFYQIESPDA